MQSFPQQFQTLRNRVRLKTCLVQRSTIRSLRFALAEVTLVHTLDLKNKPWGRFCCFYAFKCYRGEQWSFFGSYGMVMFFFLARTIGINGFSMVLLLLDHHHLMFFSPLTIAFNGFLLVLGSLNHHHLMFFSAY